MKLVAIAKLTVPEGSFSAGQEFTTTDDIGARVVAGGYARPAGAAAPVAQREPEVTHRDPEPAAPRRRRK
jgi:hypothetical protein